MSSRFSSSLCSCSWYCSSAFLSSSISSNSASFSSISSAQASSRVCSSSRKARARWSTRLLSSLRPLILFWRCFRTWASWYFSIFSTLTFSRSPASMSRIFLFPRTSILMFRESFSACFFICSSISLLFASSASLRCCTMRSSSRRLRSSSCRARSASASRISCFLSFSMASRSWRSRRLSLSSLRRSISTKRCRMSFVSSSMRFTMFCEICCFSSFSFLFCSSGAMCCMACCSLCPISMSGCRMLFMLFGATKQMAFWL
mmetsp:Transcript_82225/g.233120  ORF Transcript_82225/g.233120 Transcript_82225/m.233120 type:complete len:260 (-) Transcript_82225:1529-2308(-)